MDPDVDVGASPGGDDTGEVLLNEFAAWLDERRGVSAATVVNYCMQTRKFLAELAGPVEASVTGLDAGKVTVFVEAYCQGRSVWSAKAMVTSLRAFLRFAHVSGRTRVLLVGAVPAVASWRGAGLPKGLPAADVERLVAGRCGRDTACARRDHAIVVLLARLGLRAAEVAGLGLDDIGWHAGQITVRGKGDRVEQLPLPHEPGAAITAWLTDGRPSDVETRALFTTVRRPFRPLTPCAVRQIVGRAFDHAGLARVGAHRLRHSLATELLRAGASLLEVGQVLRHRSMLSTSVYAKVDQNTLRPLTRRWPGASW